MSCPALLVASALLTSIQGNGSLATPPGSGPSRPTNSVLLMGTAMPAELHDGNCIPPAERRAVEAEIAAFHRAHPGLNPGGSSGPEGGRALSARYEFYPIGANWYRDAYLLNYVDLNPLSAIRDWACGSYTYNSHQGHDDSLLSFAEQAVGVPIFAALPGIVTATHDGEPDMNTTGPNVTANYVVVWHGGKHYTYYWHMRTGSVAVVTGQQVAAGEQLGLVGSSGRSTGPHLHFETGLDGTVYEPFAGNCRAGESGWVDQLQIDKTFRIADFAFSEIDVTNYRPPAAYPRTGQLAFAEQSHWFWFIAYNLPASSTWDVRYYRPDGVLDKSGSGTFGANPFYRWSLWYFAPTIENIGAIPGTWRMELDVNGTLEVSAPVEVKPVRDPEFNRPPAAVDGLRFDPATPHAGKALFCRLDPSLVNEDPDYDVVGYTYVWTVNGVEKRRVTIAGHADALQADLVHAGDLIRCEVTPGDGLLSAPSAWLEVDVCRGSTDFDGSGSVDTDDFDAFVRAFEMGTENADFDGTGFVDTDDFDEFVQAFEAGC